MKQVELPISRSFVTASIDLWKAAEDMASGKCNRIPIVTPDFSRDGKELDQARTNGGLIVWSAICLEEKLEAMIAKYMFPDTEVSNDRGRQFFVSKIVKADILSYATKKRLANDIVNDGDFLKGTDKDKFSQGLKKVMNFRNAFAHGDIFYRVGSGCILNYWQGSAKQDILNDEYWKSIEECFKVAHDLSDQIIKQL